MGKNHQHKKKLKSERAKVHITSKTKFLPKGQNVTNTAFKIKPIIIQEQLKEKDKSLILNKRKQSIPEITAKLKHYNDTLRVQACEELIDMIKHHSFEIIQPYLSTIIQNSSSLIQDRTRKVRKMCGKLIKEIVSQAPEDMVKPFFKFLIGNLRCAMTNLDKNVQEDSLLFIDSLLQHTPSLLAQSSKTFFPDFVALISKRHSESSLERTLTLNLKSKMSNVQWRIQFLERLRGVLDAIVKEYTVSSENSGDPCQVIKTENVYYIPLYKSVNGLEFGQLSDFFNDDSINILTYLNNAMPQVIPLLNAMWLEVAPEVSLKKNAPKSLAQDSDVLAVLAFIRNMLNLCHK